MIGEVQHWWSSADWITAVATAIGAAGAIAASGVAIYAAFDARRSATAQRRDAEVLRNETKRQGTIALEAMLLDYHKAILSWADESINWLSEARSLTYLDPSKMNEGNFFTLRAECLSKLSALIDRGRLFFPNEAPDQHGQDKPRAFRGFRPVVLDQLKDVYDVVGELQSARPSSRPARELRETITKCKKEFVSEIQRVVDPQERQRRLIDILSAPSASAAAEVVTAS
jgi:hypothetical protein